VVVDRYVDIFSAIDEEFSEALRVANRKGVREEGWDADQMIAHAQAMVAQWTIMQEMTGQFGDVITEASFGRMADAAGGMQDFADGLEAFQSSFVDSGKALRDFQADLTTEFEELGLQLPDTSDAFRELVMGVDMTTEAGRILYAQLIALAPAMVQFYEATKPLTDLMDTVDDQLAELTLTTFQNELRDIAKWLQETTDEAKKYGASQEQLARISRAAALEVQKAIKSLKAEISDLVGQLYGTAEENRLADIEAQIAVETQYLQDQQDAASELYNTEMERYNASKAAAESIGDYLASLAQGGLSILTPKEKLDAARAEYETTLAAAAGGDAAALADITGRSDAFLKASRAYYASGQKYADDFNQVNQELRSLSGSLEQVLLPKAPPDYSTSATLSSLETQRTAVQYTIDQPDRAELARQLAQHLGDLGLALDTSVWDLLKANGINLQQLAQDLGLVTSRADEQLLEGLGDMAGLLHVDLIDLATRLGVDLARLGDLITAAMGDYSQAFRDYRAWFAGTVAGESVTVGGMTYTRGEGTSATLQTGSGTYDIDQSSSLLQLARDIPEMNASLQSNYGQDFGGDQYLQKYAQAVADYQAWFDSTGSGDTASVDGMDYIRGTGDTALLKTKSGSWTIYKSSSLRGLARDIPEMDASLRKNYGVDFSYKEGTDHVPRDMVAEIHQGEKIIDPASSAILDRYGIRVTGANDPALMHAVERLTRVMSQPASNDTAYSRPDIYHSQDSEAATEIRSLKAEVVQLRKDMTQQHDGSVLQREQVSEKVVEAIEDSSEKTAIPVDTKKVA